jgi:hypothetical protein
LMLEVTAHAMYGGVHQKSLHRAKQGYAGDLASMPHNLVI